MLNVQRWCWLGEGEAAGQVVVEWYPLVIYNYWLVWIDQTFKIDWCFQTYIIVELYEGTTKNMRRQSVLLGQASQNNVWQQSVGENQLPHIYLSTAYNELINVYSGSIDRVNFLLGAVISKTFIL